MNQKAQDSAYVAVICMKFSSEFLGLGLFLDCHHWFAGGV